MADRRGVIVPLVILAFIFLSPDPVRTPPGRFIGPTIDDAVAEEQHSLSVLQNSTFSASGLTNKDGSALNLTGLEPDRGYSWAVLPQVQGKAQRWLGYAGGDWGGEALELDTPEGYYAPLYRNVTGIVHGKWVRSKLEEGISKPHINLTEYAPQNPFGQIMPRRFGRNITGPSGSVGLRFHDRQRALPAWLNDVPGNATNIDLEMTISDEEAMEEHELRLLGVYFPTVGQAMLTTTTDKFAGIFTLPHFAMSERMFEASRMVLNESISRAIQRQIDGETERMNPWSPSVDGGIEAQIATPKCELVVYLQQLAPLLPQTADRSTVLQFLEREMRFPTGAFLPSAPELRFAMIAFSPDCGYVIESQGPPDYVPQEGNHLTGPKLEVLFNNSRHHLLIFTVSLTLQLVLLMRQMREASTPSTRSRISFYTIAMLALGDGFITMAFLLISLFIGGLWVNLVGTAFLAFVSVSFFGMRFLMDIWQVQAPERARREREEAEQERQRDERFRVALQRIREEQRIRNLEPEAPGDAIITAMENADAIAAQQEGTSAAVNEESQPVDTEHTDSTTPSVQQPASVPPAPTPPAPVPPAPAPAPPAPAPLPPLPPPPAPPAAPPGSLPLPVTASRPTDTGATPVFMPSDQEGLEPIAQTNAAAQLATATGQGQSFGSLYTRFYLLLLATLFLSLNATAWAAPLRRVYFTSISLIYLSFWLPQIKRNVERNCRHALNWEYVIGQSALRLVPYIYFYSYSGNVLFAEVDYVSLALMAVWLWIQIVMLASQEFVGPRWFVRKDWAPPAYDYHPVLREDEEGATMPIGFSEASGAASTPSSPIVDRERRASGPLKRRDSTIAKETKQEKGKRVFDCAICMQDLEVSVVEAGSSDKTSGPAGLLARRMYMVTPCRHIFHSACLEGWMKYRLQCPICRETLPPL